MAGELRTGCGGRAWNRDRTDRGLTGRSAEMTVADNECWIKPASTEPRACVYEMNRSGREVNRRRNGDNRK